uniref:SAM-dependent methyltransferase n=1 Tax=Paulinella chromatophora TaxID=39717 RepID=B1X5A3_PAUCH|nr:hypothetical protein PCC_0706 [Paulinella chromatophora]ACB43122.1 hypothetical protein PCC_0706 [Paulinella chromatophora]
MQKLPNLTIDRFLEDGFDLRRQLAEFLVLTEKELEYQLLSSTDSLAGIHPGNFNLEQVGTFYENTVGINHLLELAAWHLSGSSNYIADTLRLQASFARGQHLDFGGGIATHALAAAALPEVENVWFVDLNPHNRAFAKSRAEQLGLESKLYCSRDLDDPRLPKRFDTIVCLDVLEHLNNPSNQLEIFAQRMGSHSAIILNWHFFKGFTGEYPFHFDDLGLVEYFFKTVQHKFIEIFHPYLITARAYRLNELK